MGTPVASPSILIGLDHSSPSTMFWTVIKSWVWELINGKLSNSLKCLITLSAFTVKAISVST